MQIRYHKNFEKQFRSLKPTQKRRLKAALHVFIDNPRYHGLYNHPLTGEWTGYYSIAFGGDWRAHYKLISDNEVLFVAVGTHSQLYK